MEEIKEKLLHLLQEEIDDLSIGHTYNQVRLVKMKNLCHLITYINYAKVNDFDLAEIVRFYE